MEIIIGIIIGAFVMYWIMKKAIKNAVDNTAIEMINMATRIEKGMTRDENHS